MRRKERVQRKEKRDYKKVRAYTKAILFITMLVLIYFVSPRITQLIQDGAKYIYELDKNIITRIVELIISVVLVGIVTFSKKEK